MLTQLNRGNNDPYSATERATIEQLYAEIFNKPLRTCNCPDKWRDAVTEALIYLKKHRKMKQQSKYRLRAGVVLQIAGSSEVYTNDNLTDEVAKNYLKKNPNAKGRFEVIPDKAADNENNPDVDAAAAAQARIAELEAENAALRHELDVVRAEKSADEVVRDESAADNDETVDENDANGEKIASEAADVAEAAKTKKGRKKAEK